MGDRYQPRGRYQLQDAEFIDYGIYNIPGVRGDFRGPPLQSDDYVACVGAAQTFGRFVSTPYPRLVARALGIDSLNLGRGGAGPTFAMSNPVLMGYINRARIVVVQVVSGRSQSNSLFQTVNHGTMGIYQRNGEEISSGEFYTRLLEQGEEPARRIVAETQANYVQAMTALLDAITAPKVLFWFSVRRPDYEPKFRLPLHDLWGDFPQLVNRGMVDRLRSRADAYVECVSRRGLPQTLRGRKTVPGESVDSASLPDESAAVQLAAETVNTYYPSPEMHEDASALLVPECRALLARR